MQTGKHRGVWQFFDEAGIFCREECYQADHLEKYFIVEGIHYCYYDKEGCEITMREYYGY